MKDRAALSMLRRAEADGSLRPVASLVADLLRSLDVPVYPTEQIAYWVHIGAILAFGYFFYLFRMFKGKVRLEGEGY